MLIRVKYKILENIYQVITLGGYLNIWLHKFSSPTWDLGDHWTSYSSLFEFFALTAHFLAYQVFWLSFWSLMVSFGSPRFLWVKFSLYSCAWQSFLSLLEEDTLTSWFHCHRSLFFLNGFMWSWLFDYVKCWFFNLPLPHHKIVLLFGIREKIHNNTLFSLWISYGGLAVKRKGTCRCPLDYWTELNIWISLKIIVS